MDYEALPTDLTVHSFNRSCADSAQTFAIFVATLLALLAKLLQGSLDFENFSQLFHEFKVNDPNFVNGYYFNTSLRLCPSASMVVFRESEIEFIAASLSLLA